MIRPALLAACLALHSAPLAADRTAKCTEDAMLVFDASRSMTNVSNDSGGRSRIAEARDALRDVLPQVTPFRNLGLVVYGPGRADVCGYIDMRLPPTPDAAALIQAEVDRIEPDGDTPLTQAVFEAAKTLRHRERPGSIVLITDGRETCGGAPCDLADMLTRTSADLTVHVIGFRTLVSSFEWQTFGDDDGRNTQIIARCLAERTGGTYVTTNSTEDLVAALQDILGCPVVSLLDVSAPTRKPFTR